MTPIRIGTWNVEYAVGAAKNAARLGRLRVANADVWVLTETHDDLCPGAEYGNVSTPSRFRTVAGSRWVTIWSRFPVVQRLTVRDESRTVAATFQLPGGPLLVYGTVMPWHSDKGPTGDAANWTEQYRVVPEQAAEWRTLRDEHPGVPLCVAGDFNMDLGGKHHYGTKQGRALLRQGLADADLACVTETPRVPPGKLKQPPIDHVAVSSEVAAGVEVVEAWPGTTPDGVRLSDHGGLVVGVRLFG